jgi:hypothetical protein
MTQTMYFDETPIVTISALLALCDECKKYYRFGTNHWAAFRRLRKDDSNMSYIGDRLGMEFPKNQPPKEIVQAIQAFLGKSKVSNEKVRQMLVSGLPHHAYLSKYSLSNTTNLRREFDRFKVGVIKTINQRSKLNGGIRMLPTRPIRGSKKAGKSIKSKISRGSTNAPPGNARGYALGGPVV